MKNINRLSLIGLLVFTLLGCDDGGKDGGKVDLRGAVQKGPFVTGTSVSVTIQDSGLNPTGQVFQTQTLNDRGEFAISFTTRSPVALEGNGYYFNEVTGQLSASTLTLRAFYVPTATTVQSAYINMVTHLTAHRVKKLVTDGLSFAAAVEQAESDLVSQLNITYPGFAPGSRGVALNLEGGDTEDNAYLLAVSSVLMQTAMLREGAVEGNIQELLNQVALDFEDGEISEALKAEITAGLAALEVEAVAYHLGRRFETLGSSAEVPDMNRVLDQDRDGLRNIEDNCPMVSNADQANGDADGTGDVCDVCPATPCDKDCIPADVEHGLENDVCVEFCPISICYSEEQKCILPSAIGGVGGVRPFCSDTCDPTVADSCPVGTACEFVQTEWLSPESPLQIFACVPDDMRLPQSMGTQCESFCSARLGCALDPLMDRRVCFELCDLNDESSCDGMGCSVPTQHSWGIEEYSHIGICPLPIPRPEGYACQVGEIHCEIGFYCGEDLNMGVSCIQSGELYEYCDVNSYQYFEIACGAGMGCFDPNQFVPFGIFEDPSGSYPGDCNVYTCCLPAGAENQPCRIDEGNRCDLGLACHPGSNTCLLTPGSIGRFCRTTGEACDAGLACGNYNCTYPLGDGLPYNCCLSTSCNNGVVEPAEECDTNELNGQTCESLGLGAGELTCDERCMFVKTNCIP